MQNIYSFTPAQKNHKNSTENDKTQANYFFKVFHSSKSMFDLWCMGIGDGVGGGWIVSEDSELAFYCFSEAFFVIVRHFIAHFVVHLTET